MLKLVLALFLSSGCVLSQVAWMSRARVPNPSGYFSRLVQEMIYDVEKLEWCNLKVPTYSQTLNEQLYHMRVNGTVTYANGFVVAIQSMDITNMEQLITSRTVDSVVTPFATVRGRLNMRHVTVGADVILNLVDEEHEEEQRYTGHFTHVHIQYQLDVTKNMLNGEVTSSPSLLNLSAGSGVRMIYMPANNVTEVLSRRFIPGNNWDGVISWGREIFGPMLVDIATNRVQFPELCLNNCPP